MFTIFFFQDPVSAISDRRSYSTIVFTTIAVDHVAVVAIFIVSGVCNSVTTVENHAIFSASIGIVITIGIAIIALFGTTVGIPSEAIAAISVYAFPDTGIVIISIIVVALFIAFFNVVMAYRKNTICRTTVAIDVISIVAVFI